MENNKAIDKTVNVNIAKRTVIWAINAINGKYVVFDQICINIAIATFIITILSINLWTGIVCTFFVSLLLVIYSVKTSMEFYKNIRIKMVGENRNESWKEKIGSWIVHYGFIAFLLAAGYATSHSVAELLVIEQVIFFTVPKLFAAFSMPIGVILIQLWNRIAVKPLLRFILKHNSGCVVEISSELWPDLLALESLSETGDICLKLGNVLPFRYELSLMDLRILIKKAAGQAMLNLLLKQYPYLNQESIVENLNKKLIDAKADLNFAFKRINEIKNSFKSYDKKITSLNKSFKKNTDTLKKTKLSSDEKRKMASINDELMSQLRSMQISQSTGNNSLEFEEKMINKINEKIRLLREQRVAEKIILNRVMIEVKKADTERCRVEQSVKKLICYLKQSSDGNLLMHELTSSLDANNAAQAIQESIEMERIYLDNMLGQLRQQQQKGIDGIDLTLQIEQQEAYQQQLETRLSHLLQQLQILTSSQQKHLEREKATSDMPIYFESGAALIERMRKLEKELDSLEEQRKSRANT